MKDSGNGNAGQTLPHAPCSAEWRENAKKRIGWTKLDGCKWRSPEGEIYYQFHTGAFAGMTDMTLAQRIEWMRNIMRQADVLPPNDQVLRQPGANQDAK